ncbi:MAG TPA: FmdB family zinc ribbon protein [Chthoniobacterales bacterium]|jgi:putative FmdB family regulatory protein
MPTYEYKCEKCNQTFEVFQSMKDEPYAFCPKESCRLETWGAGKVKRLLGTGAGLIFKGSGFYITDYRSPDYKESAKKESGPPKSDAAPKSDGPKGPSEKSTGSSGPAPSTGSSGAAPSTGA